MERIGLCDWRDLTTRSSTRRQLRANGENWSVRLEGRRRETSGCAIGGHGGGCAIGGRSAWGNACERQSTVVRLEDRADPRRDTVVRLEAPWSSLGCAIGGAHLPALVCAIGGAAARTAAARYGCAIGGGRAAGGSPSKRRDTVVRLEGGAWLPVPPDVQSTGCAMGGRRWILVRSEETRLCDWR